MCEWLKQLVCKTSLVKEFVGSNPTSSTIFEFIIELLAQVVEMVDTRVLEALEYCSCLFKSGLGYHILNFTLKNIKFKLTLS